MEYEFCYVALCTHVVYGNSGVCYINVHQCIGNGSYLVGFIFFLFLSDTKAILASPNIKKV
jgi:hypothetical protein